MIREALLCSTILLCTACPQAVPVVEPIASCVTKVLQDAIKGMTIDQIVKDVGVECVASADEVITILLGTDNPNISKTIAYGEAKARTSLFEKGN